MAQMAQMGGLMQDGGLRRGLDPKQPLKTEGQSCQGITMVAHLIGVQNAAATLPQFLSPVLSVQ
jgi:hypothetical protein